MALLANCRRADAQRYSLSVVHALITGVGASNELLLATPPLDDMSSPEPLALPVHNRLGALLLPAHTPEQFLGHVDLHLNRPAFVMYDAQGRVHQLVLDDCLFLQLMRMWEPPELQTLVLRIDSVDHDQRRLRTADAAALLRLPPGLPPELQAWQPFGEYEVTHARDGRVFSVQRHDTSLPFAALWETRLYED